MNTYPVPTLLRTFLVVLAGSAVAACGTAPESATEGGGTPPAGEEIFVERGAETGLDFTHFNGMSGALHLAEITCGAGALFDYDNDGDLDAYLLQGHMLGGAAVDDSPVPPRHPQPLADRLYRNDLTAGALRFTDVTESLGVAATAYGCAVAAGDYDNDGWVDLYLANLGANQLLRNEDGRFRDVTAGVGVGDARSGVAAAFFDYDRDGWLDLFVANNMAFDNSGATVCRSLSGAPDYCGPGAYPSEPDLLYRNRGDGTFEDVTQASGIGSVSPQPTLGAVAGDFNDDGWTDLYVANDGQPNNLWINQRDGTFSDEALLAGCALNDAGAAEASMGIDAADFDADGDLDVFLTHLVKETNTLYANDGSGIFDDVTAAAGLASPSLAYTSFGVGWLDYDNDGWLDLLVASGAVTLVQTLVAAKDPFPLHQTNQLFRNLGGTGGIPRFAEVTAEAGDVFRLSEVSRGVAFGDVDNDGDADALVINNGGPARLLVNQVGQRRPWIGLRLVEGEPPRDVPGARAAVLRAGRPALWRWVATGGSYGSASDPRLLFGLGDDAEVDGVRVVWPDGSAEEWAEVEVGRYSTLRRGEGGRPADEPR